MTKERLEKVLGLLENLHILHVDKLWKSEHSSDYGDIITAIELIKMELGIV